MVRKNTGLDTNAKFASNTSVENPPMVFRDQLFVPDKNRDYDEQLIEVTGGNGIVKCSTFMPCAVGQEAWVAVGPAVDYVFGTAELKQIFTVKWPKLYGIDTGVFDRGLARMRSFLRALNDSTLHPPTGVTEQDIRFYVFTSVYRLLVPTATVETMLMDFEAARQGVRIIHKLLAKNKRVRALNPDMEAVTTGLLDAGLSPNSYVAYGNLLRGMAWSLHYMHETGVSRPDIHFIREVLRVRPPSGWPRRRASADVALGGHTIPKNDVIYAAIRATHLASGGHFRWPKCSEGAYVFGAGRHRCPVKQFSEKAMLVMLNGPGPRPAASVAGLNSEMPTQQWL